MPSRQLVASLLLAASCVLAACGSDAATPSSSGASPSSAASPSASDPSSADKGTTDIATDTSSAPEAATSTNPPSSAPSGPQQCAQQRDITIKIVLGDIDCTTAYGVAFRVDRDGDKRQTVAGYVCEFGNATVRPTIFTCSNPTSGAEFAVDET